LRAAEPALSDTGRWPAEKAWTWYGQHPWLVGCNFVPSTAVNDIEMWQKESFDPATIDRELGWAQDLGFNTVRIFLNEVVWESDPEGLKQRLGQFLEIADRHHLSSLVILFDDCFGPTPQIGKQPDPVPRVHNSRWVQSPGAARRDNPAAWPKLEQYVKDVVGRFGSDKRVLAWEVYNEPTQSLPLVEAAFQWAREAKPDQPLTATVFGTPAMEARIKDLSDVISFHNYRTLPELKADVARLQPVQRPLLCTEWMARPHASLFETHLPYFKAQNIACWNWGLVAGRIQTYYGWGKPGTEDEPPLWFHDILRHDGTPYLASEAAVIRYATGVSKTAPPH
jgi:hypothetical protein